MKMRRKKKEQEDSGGSPSWMTTFGDMMTLLLVFFVLLYSFSVLDLHKFMGFISAFQNQIGVMDGGETYSEKDLIGAGDLGESFSPEQLQYIREVMSGLQEYLEDEGLTEKVEMEHTQRGYVIRITGQVLFELGSAEVKPQGENLLDEIMRKINELPNDIRIEGHTDNLPISTDRFPSNWELSTARATSVVRYYLNNYDIIPEQFSAAGYSEYKPLYDNDTPENRARNRRVEIVILNTYYHLN